MTSVAQRSQTAAAGEPSRQSRRVRIGLMVEGIHVGVAVDAVAPIARQIQAIVDLADTRLAEIGAPRLQPAGREVTKTDRAPVRGRWALCWVDGTALRFNRSLSDQGVTEGTQLWLRFVDDTEARTPVIEHVTSAVPAELRRQWKDIDPAFAARVGAVMVAAAVLVVVAVLARWRYGHDDALAPGAIGALALGLLAAAAVLHIRSARHRRAAAGDPAADDDEADELAAELFLADALLLVGAAAAAVGAALAVPGPLGAPQAGVGAAVVAGRLGADHSFHRPADRFVHGGAGGGRGSVGGRGGADAAADVGGDPADGRAAGRGGGRQGGPDGGASSGADPAAGVPVGQWALDVGDPPGPADHGGGGRREGPAVGGAGVGARCGGGHRPGAQLPVRIAGRAVCAAGGIGGGVVRSAHPSALAAADPGGRERRLGGAARPLLHRSLAGQRVGGAAVVIVAAVCARYAIGLWTASAILVACAVTVAVPAAGLVAAMVVPRKFYTPVVKQVVEWIEYVLLVALWPLGFWLMDVFAAIRYR